MQMYMADYDRFPPSEHRPEVVDYFVNNGCSVGCCYPQANPYLRWPVVLDEYVKNRDVWRCPSAKFPALAATIIPGDKDWFWYWQNGSYCACVWSWPQGWGGTVTDTNQDNDPCVTPSEDSGAMEFGIAIMETNIEKPFSVVDDPVKYVFVADRGIKPNWWCAEQIAFADVCRIKWGDVASDPGGGCSVSCDGPVNEGCGVWWEDVLNRFWSDGTMRDKYTRHLGGSNLGFLDGHAAWWKADAIIAGAGNWKDPNPQLQGVNCQCLPNAWSS